MLEQKVHENILKGVLQVEHVGIERIHRLGKSAPKRNRPIILKLLNCRNKMNTLNNCYKQKGSGFSWCVRTIRKKLCNYAKPRKESGDKISLVHDKLHVNGDLYQCDDKTNDVVPHPTESCYFKSKAKKNQESGTHTPHSSARHAAKEITFCNINSCSILKKREFLEALHLGVAPDFVALTETWLTSDVQDSEITPPNYVVVRKDRSTRGGGGVVLLIRKEISYVTLLMS